MKTLCALLIFTSLQTFAAAKTYQVTGPVLEIKGDTIIVQKGSEKWEIDKEASTKADGLKSATK